MDERIYGLMYYNEIKKYKLSDEETEKVLENLRNGVNVESCRDTLVTANLALVIDIANKYNIPNGHYDDVVQEGNMGLTEASRRYDINKGIKFSTYAYWYINGKIMNYINENIYNYSVPRYCMQDLNVVNKAKEYLHIINEKITTENIVNILNSDEFKNWNNGTRKTCTHSSNDFSSIDAERIEKLNLINAPLNLDEAIGDEDNTTMYNYIEDDDNIAEEVAKKLDGEKLWKALEKVSTPKDYRVYDLYCHECKGNMAEVAKIVGITRERVRMIINKLPKLIYNEQIKSFNPNI